MVQPKRTINLEAVPPGSTDESIALKIRHLVRTIRRVRAWKQNQSKRADAIESRCKAELEPILAEVGNYKDPDGYAQLRAESTRVSYDRQGIEEAERRLIQLIDNIKWTRGQQDQRITDLPVPMVVYELDLIRKGLANARKESITKGGLSIK